MDPFIGEIRAFPFTFAPQGWFECLGQQLPVQSYPALFSVIGNMYAPTNQSSTYFYLPNLQVASSLPSQPGNVLIGQGVSASSGTAYSVGQQVGTSTVTLTSAQMPLHQHAVQTQANSARALAPSAANMIGDPVYTTTTGSPVTYPTFVAEGSALQVGMAPAAVSTVGTGQQHDNHQPFLAFRYCIAYEGIYPIKP